MNIDHDGSLPLHVQVERLIRELLKQSRYRQGELLPPEARLASELGVSRSTVRSAISRLVQEGVLERKAGHGTHYVNQPLQTGLKRWPSFTKEMERRGIKVTVFSLHCEKIHPPDHVALALRLAGSGEGEKILKMERVRGYNEIPAVYSISWFHNRCKLEVNDNFAMPLYDLIMEKSGIDVKSSSEEISAAIADESLAGRLCCNPGDPILVRQRVVRNSKNQEMEHNFNYYRADRFTYELTLRK